MKHSSFSENYPILNEWVTSKMCFALMLISYFEHLSYRVFQPKKSWNWSLCLRGSRIWKYPIWNLQTYLLQASNKPDSQNAAINLECQTTLFSVVKIPFCYQNEILALIFKQNRLWLESINHLLWYVCCHFIWPSFSSTV